MNLLAVRHRMAMRSDRLVSRRGARLDDRHFFQRRPDQEIIQDNAVKPLQFGKIALDVVEHFYERCLYRVAFEVQA
jgi:hypothetical protein